MAYSNTHLKALAFLDKAHVPASHVDAFLSTHSRATFEACTPDEVVSITQSITGVLWEDMPKYNETERNMRKEYHHDRRKRDL